MFFALAPGFGIDLVKQEKDGKVWTKNSVLQWMITDESTYISRGPLIQV